MVLPDPDQGRDDDARKMIGAELDRIRFFGQHARNHANGEGWLGRSELHHDNVLRLGQ